MAAPDQQRQLQKRQQVLNGLYAAVELFAPDAPMPDPSACLSKRDWERRMYRLRDALRRARATAHWGWLVRDLIARPRMSASRHYCNRVVSDMWLLIQVCAHDELMCRPGAANNRRSRDLTGWRLLVRCSLHVGTAADGRCKTGSCVKLGLCVASTRL